jgi:hypothetical protein
LEDLRVGGKIAVILPETNILRESGLWLMRGCNYGVI